MILVIFLLVVAVLTPVHGVPSEHRNGVGHPITSLLNATASATISQVEVTLGSQLPFSNADGVLKISPGETNSETVPQYNFGSLPGASLLSAGVQVSLRSQQLSTNTNQVFKGGLLEIAHKVSFLLPTTVQSSQNVTTSPSISDLLFTTSSKIHSAVTGTETINHKIMFTHSPITSSLGVKFTNLPALILGSQTIKADEQKEYTLVHGQTPTPPSTTAPGSDSLTTFATHQTLSTQSQLVFDSSSSQSSFIAPTSAMSKIRPLLTLDGQRNTASSLGQYIKNGQTLMPDTMTTVSGTPISVAPKAGDRVAANSTHAPSANTTTGSETGPAGTSVQVFKGGVLGGRDGLWSSSITLVVGIIVLLWL